MAGYSVIAFVSYVLAFAVLQSIIGRRAHARNIPRRDAPARLILMIVWTLMLVFSLPLLKHEQPNRVAMAIGSIVAAFGLFISMWAQKALDRFWVGGIGLHKQHVLITKGPYRYVRHPLYSGMLISAIGLGVFSLNSLFFGAMILFSCSYAIRIPAEEQMLRNKFKRRHEQYAATTGLLFPRIRKRG